MRAGVARRAGVGFGLGAVALAALAFATPETRGRISALWLARGLDSKDAAVRARARANLLEIGRPAIDNVFARLVASEIADASAQPGGVWVLVAHRRDIKVPDYVLVDEVLAVSNARRPEPGWYVGYSEVPLAPAASLLSRRGARSALMVLVEVEGSTRMRELREEIPLDGEDLAAEILAAVRERLARTP